MRDEIERIAPKRLTLLERHRGEGIRNDSVHQIFRAFCTFRTLIVRPDRLIIASLKPMIDPAAVVTIIILTICWRLTLEHSIATAIPLIATALPLIVEYWFVPLGIAVLFFYGTFHFNTPDYDLTPADKMSIYETHNGRLISLAPPIFTTSRTYFRRYSLRYVFVLQSAFLIIVFGWSAVVDAGPLFGWKLPAPHDVEFRAIWALFALTGLLSSFPYFKEVDSWLLEKLHRAALIPESARLLAGSLYGAKFIPDEATKDAVKKLLIMRDTIRVAEGEAIGSLEQAVLRTLWLKESLERTCAGERNLRFRSRIQRDLTDIERVSASFVTELRRFLRNQESQIPDDVRDIDGFIETSRKSASFLELASRRAALRDTCDALYFRMCLLAALFVNATRSTPEGVNRAFEDMGFQVEVIRVPIWHWEALAWVALGIFLTVLAFNTVVMPVYEFLNLVPVMDHKSEPDRKFYFLFSLFTTALYGVVILIAIWLKRHWARKDDRTQNTPQNLIIGISAYLANSGLLFLAISIFPPPDHPENVWMLVFGQFSACVAGYFIGVYIDRALKGATISFSLASRQALYQGFAGLITAVYMMPPPHNVTFTPMQSAAMWVFIACQSGLAGFMMSYLVQRFYRLELPEQANPKVAPTILVGDLKVQRKEESPSGAGDFAIASRLSVAP